MSVLEPLSYALAQVVAAAHLGLTSLGADPDAGLTWLLCIGGVVVAALSYRNRKDADSMRLHMEERRRISVAHGVPRLGCLPMLIQLPIWLALYHLLADVAAGSSVGAMTPELVASLGTATLLGVPLAERGYLGAGPAHLAVVAGLALAAAALSYVTQRHLVAPNSSTDGLPEALVTAQQLMPALSALGLLVAAGVVPVALLCNWVCNSTWTLGQSAIIWRWFPTPGSPAAQRASRRK